MGRKRNRQRPRDHLVANPHYEVVPLSNAVAQASLLPAGAVVTVTTSARQGTDKTVEVAEILAKHGFDAVPHLAARQFRDEGELTGILERLDSAGIRHLFVVGGDTAGNEGPYPDGLALLEAIDRLGYRCDAIGIPAYPEGHHEIDSETLWASLGAKQRYATYLVTQLCFSADTITRFAAEAARRGIQLPIQAGVPGVVDRGKLLRMSMRVGVGDSVKFLRGNARVTRLLAFGGYRPDGLVRGLDADNVSGLHIYTFNHVGPTVRWLQARERVA